MILMSMTGNDSFMMVDGVAIPTPTTAEWGLQDVSAGESGRTEDTQMHKNRVGQKRKWTLSWSVKDLHTASTIIKAFNPEYVKVTMWDFLQDGYSTRTYYTGDRKVPIKLWWKDKKLVGSVSFDIIEQ